MPQAVPALIVNTVRYALSIGASKVIMALAGTLPAIFLRQRQLKKEAAAARRAALDRIQDRTLSFPVDNAPWRFILGRDVKVGCGIYPVGTSGPRQEFFHVIAVVANHEISAIKRIFIGDYELLTDASGVANAGRFFLANPRPQEHTATANASGQVTLPTPPIENPVRWVTVAGRASVPGSSPVSGSTVSGLTPGTQYKFTYRTNQGSGTPLVSIAKYLGSTTQAADPLLTAELGAGVWPATAQGKGVAYVRMTFSYSPDIFPNGIENITVIADGPAVFDPRTSTNVLTDNIALQMRHVWTAPDMGNRPSSLVDDASVIAAANACDEQVQISASPATFQARYFGAGTFTDDTDFVSVLDSLAEAMAGGYSIQARKLVLRAGVYQAPTLPTLVEDDLADGALELTTTQPRAQLFNAVTARFNDPARNWEEASVSPVTDSTFATQDGGQIWADAGSLPWTKDNIAGQRLLRVQLNQARQAVGLTANFNMNAYPVTPGDRVPLTMPTFGWSNKVFLCKKRSFSPAGAVRLTLVEDGASVYAWNLGQATPYDPLPNSNLPLPYTVAAPASLTLASGNAELLQLQDGTVVPRLRISWPRSTDPNVLAGGQVQVEWMRADQTLDSVTGYPGKTEPLVGDAVETLLQSVEEGFVYLVRVRFRNGLGIYSPWIYSEPHKVLGKSDLPPDATAFTVTTLPSGDRRYTVTLPSGLPLDIAGAQIRYQAGASITWASATKLPQTIEIQRGRDEGGFVSFERAEPGPGQWTFEVRLLDGSGNPSPAGVRTTVTLGPVISDAINNAAGTFSFAPNAFWDFAGGGLGWSAANATLGATSTVLVVTSSGVDPQIFIGGLSVTGAVFNRVRARIRRTAGSGWDGTVYYATSGHGFSASFLDTIPDPTAGQGNAWVVAEWDMATLTAGGTDWLDNTILQLRLDLGTSAADVFEVDWIAVGRIGPTQITNDVTSGGGRRIQEPVGGFFTAEGFSLPGAIYIVLPAAWTDTMIRFEVDIYEYTGGAVQTYSIGGYTLSTPESWINTWASFIGAPSTKRPVRLVRDTSTGRPAVIIGAFAGVWQYPKVRVRNLMLGFVNFGDNFGWGNPFNITLETSRAYTAEVLYTDPRPGGAFSGLDQLNSGNVNSFVGPNAITVVSDTKPSNTTLGNVTDNSTATSNIATLSHTNSSGETQQVLVNYYALHDAIAGIVGGSSGTTTCSSAVRVSGVTYTGQPSEFLELAKASTAPATGTVSDIKPHGGAFVVTVPSGSTVTVNYETKIVNAGTFLVSSIASRGITMSLAVLKR